MSSARRPLGTAVFVLGIAATAVAQRKDPDYSMVLALDEFTCAAGGASASTPSMLWFAVPVGTSARGRQVVGLYATAGRRAGQPGQPLWVPLDEDTAVFVVPIREDGSNPVAVVDEASDLLARAVAEAHQAGLDGRSTAARLMGDLRRIVSTLRPSEAGIDRLIGVNEVRVTAGDLATARVGLVAAKQLTFQADAVSCRMSFQLLRHERFLRSIPPR